MVLEQKHFVPLRVFIRKPVNDDWQELLSLRQKSRVSHFPWVSLPLTEEACKAYISQCQNEDFEGLLICHIVNKKIVGVVNQPNFSQGFPKCLS